MRRRISGMSCANLYHRRVPFPGYSEVIHDELPRKCSNPFPDFLAVVSRWIGSHASEAPVMAAVHRSSCGSRSRSLFGLRRSPLRPARSLNLLLLDGTPMPSISRHLESLAVSASPIVEPFLQRCGIPQLLQQALAPLDPRLKLDHDKSLLVLIKNIILSQHPLYALRSWAERIVPESLGLQPQELSLLNDDCLGRALDSLFLADRATLQTSIVLQMIRAFGLKLDPFHNDSTSITFSGRFNSPPPPNEPAPAHMTPVSTASSLS